MNYIDFILWIITFATCSITFFFSILLLLRKTSPYIKGFMLCLVCYCTGAIRNILVLYKIRAINYIYDLEILNIVVLFSVCFAIYAFPKFIHSYYQVKGMRFLNRILGWSTVLLVSFSLFSYFFPVVYPFTVKLVITCIIAGIVYVVSIVIYHQIVQLKNKKFDSFMMPFIWFSLLCVPIMIPNEIFQVHKQGIMILGGVKTLPFIIILHNILFIIHHIKKLIPARTRYEKSSLTDEDILSYGNFIVQVMKQDKPYLNPDLTLKDFAQKTGLPVHYTIIPVNLVFSARITLPRKIKFS